MIGRLRGRILERHPPGLLVEVGGIAYELEAPLSAFFDLPEADAEVVLYTHLVVREDAHLLFGFRSRSERDLFRALIRVNGVGPKLALTLLSGMDASEFVRCIGEGDVAKLVRLPGVGKKTAERLVVEMGDRLNTLFGAELPAELTAAHTQPRPRDAATRVVEEAESALIALGYRPQEAARAINAAFVEGMASEEIIRRALKGMVSGE